MTRKEERLRRIGTILLALAATIGLVVVPSGAQTTGTILGVVTDPGGAALPGVKITVRNPDTGLMRVTESNNIGEYVVSLLPPSVYDIEAEASGFERYINRGVRLLVNQTARVEIHLVVGALEQTVEVRAEVVGVDLTTATISEVITREEINALPLNGRNFLQLATLVAGSVPGIQLTENFTPTTQGSSLSLPQINGMRSQANNVLLDGVDNNELYLGQAGAIPSPDSIQEFSIQTNLYGAEFGRGAGGIVNVVTKSGTNSFHGSLYEYLRNDVFDARNFFSPETPPLKRNQFGGSIGGPIALERTHFFASYEGTRTREGITKAASVPTILEKSGDFSQSAVQPNDPSTGSPFSGDVIPPNRIDPVAAGLVQFYPDPNIGTNLSSNSPIASTDLDQFMLRIDQKIGDNDHLFGRYLIQDGSAILPFTTAFLGPINVPTFPIANDWRFHTLVLSEVHVFSPTTVNEVRFGLNRAVLDGLISANPRNAQDFGFTFPSTTPIDVPQIAVVGFSAFGYTDMGPGEKATNVFQFMDVFSHTRGRHTIKAGVDVRRHQMNSRIASAYNGAYLFAGALSGNAFADFLLGLPQFFVQGGGNNEIAFRSTAFNFFAQDQISLFRNLKLTLGLRYEYFNWPHDTGDRISAFRAGQQSTVRPAAPTGLVYPGDAGIPRSTVDDDNNNFAPRLALAWDPTGSGKISVRAGYGIFYDMVPWHNISQLSIAPPFSFFPFLFHPPEFADPGQGTLPFQPGLTEIPFSQIPTPFQYNILDPDIKTSYAQQYNLSIQHEFFPNWLAQAAYVGTKGVNLISTVNLNQAVLGPGSVSSRRPFSSDFAGILAQSTQFDSSYNSLQLTLDKRPSHGLGFLASYTYSKSIDTLSTPQAFRNSVGQPTQPMDSTNIPLDRGRSAFDATHRFVLSYLYEFPNFDSGSTFARKLLSGWALNGILALQTGLPFTVLDPTDPTVTGETNDRPDLVGDPTSGSSTVERWFNTGAFQALPNPSSRFGTAGRNIVEGPSLKNWDFSIVKRTSITETVNVEFRTEFFNLFNHPNFRNPDGNITSPNFGRITETLPGNERQVQFVLRLDF